MRIKQGRVSTSVRFNFLEKYDLSIYNNIKKSTIFFGCYNPQKDFNNIINHQGLGILVWCGSDIQMINFHKIIKIKNRKNIKHIAISKFIADDLRKLGIEFKRLSIYPSKNIPDPQPLGDYIYSYVPKFRYDYYGGRIIDKLKKLLPNEKFIITSNEQYPKEEVIEFYKKSFIGLRLTQHDGLPNTVIELGLMGRRCIYNGILPNVIAWNGILDIIKKIKTEKLMIGQTNVQMAYAMSNFLNLDDSWLNEKFWA